VTLVGLTATVHPFVAEKLPVNAPFKMESGWPDVIVPDGASVPPTVPPPVAVMESELPPFSDGA
jgi:hypothetical protein